MSASETSTNDVHWAHAHELLLHTSLISAWLVRLLDPTSSVLGGKNSKEKKCWPLATCSLTLSMTFIFVRLKVIHTCTFIGAQGRLWRTCKEKELTQATARTLQILIHV